MLRFLSCAVMLTQTTILPSLAGEIQFNRDIRPLLSENCFYCHGQDGAKRQAELRLDVREDAVDAGAIEPGDVDGSEMIARIFSDDPDTLMPPPSSNRRLSAAEKNQLRNWIADGAPFQDHWAFVGLVRPDPPPVENSAWLRGDVDRFVLAKLEDEQLSPSPEADRVTLIRRLHADLIGLPPTPEAVDAFVNDTDPLAYEHLVNRLLNSQH